MSSKIKSRYFQDDANTVASVLVHDAKVNLKNLLEYYNPEDIFNMYETALFYELDSSQTLSCSKL